MTIQRNLQGKCDENVRRTIEDLSAQITSLQTAFAELKSSPQNVGLTPQQLADVAGLIGARSQAVIGQETADPSLPGAVGFGTVTSFSAGDLSPLFTTGELNVTTTPALSFVQIVQNANLLFAGPASGAAANPTFRALSAADLPYKIYVALLVQAGTSAPSATILSNTLSGAIAWTRATNGDYVGTLAAAFPANKVWSPAGIWVSDSLDVVQWVELIRDTDNTILLKTGADFADRGTLNDPDTSIPFMIQILVYP